MASPAKIANYLNFYSELPTDQVIYTKAVTETWKAGITNTFIYNTGLNDYCLPIAIFSLDGQKWFNQNGYDDTRTYFFSVPKVSDNGVITIAQVETLITQTLYIRIMCLAHPNQKPFDQAQTGSILSYKSEYNYMKVFKAGVLTPAIVGGVETPAIVDIPHNLGYIPNYRIFARFFESGSGTFYTTLLSPNERPRMGATNQVLHLDNYQTNPFILLQAYQYFYVIYYD